MRATGLQFQAPEELEIPSIAAASGWRFRSSDGSIEADVFVVERASDRQAAIEWLASSSEKTSEWGLPAISTNGALVFIVRYLGPSDDTSAAFRALGVASALAGEED